MQDSEDSDMPPPVSMDSVFKLLVDGEEAEGLELLKLEDYEHPGFSN